MNGLKFWKKFLMPCGLCAAVPVVRSQSSPDQPDSCTCKKESKMLRPSELPIYPLDDGHSKDIACTSINPPSALEQQFGAIRRSLQGVLLQWYTVSDKVSSKMHTGLEHSQHLVEYLQEEDNTMPRLGAVTIGGLSGMIFGLRGGLLKKSIYFSTGALAVGAICYPRKTEEGFQRVKYYANVGYNFIYGVKPGDDEQRAFPDIKLTDPSRFKMPTTLSELYELSVGVGSDIVNAIDSLNEKALELLTKSLDKTDSDSSRKDN